MQQSASRVPLLSSRSNALTATLGFSIASQAVTSTGAATSVVWVHSTLGISEPARSPHWATLGPCQCDARSHWPTRRECRRRCEAATPTRLPRRCRSRPPRWTDVGLFVGLFCQPAGGFWRFVAVDSRTEKSAKSPVNTGNLRKTTNAGGGTRTPDTRIMIPPLAFGVVRLSWRIPANQRFASSASSSTEAPR
jgi:hypothetical protein